MLSSFLDCCIQCFSLFCLCPLYSYYLLVLPLSISLTVSLSLSLSVSISISLSVCLYVTLYLSFSFSFSASVSFSVSVSVCLSLSLSLPRFISLSFSLSPPPPWIYFVLKICLFVWLLLWCFFYLFSVDHTTYYNCSSINWIFTTKSQVKLNHKTKRNFSMFAEKQF